MRAAILLSSLLLFITPVYAQHEHGGNGDSAPAESEATDVVTEVVTQADPHADHPAAASDDHEVHAADEDHAQHGGDHSSHGGEHVDVLGLPHGRHASGTSWLPDSTPAYSLMEQSGDWSLMYHGAAHLSYVGAEGPRGATELFAPNWAMLRATRRLDCDSQLELSGMFSLDPATVGGFGYPSLFQTGESWQGQPLYDRQHPHNYFIDLSLKYKRRLNCDSALYVYLAPVGEPALGPPAFMHRTLALDYALSPIGHHWQDATHIAYGVVTAGVQSREWQLEGSLFNGREPGEDRAAIESPTFDSYSGRLSWNPGKNLALQVSQGRLKEPEALHPGVDVTRTTASLIYNHDLGCARNWQTAVVWGRNTLEGVDFDSYLLESGLKQDGGWSPYFRVEHVVKSAEELVLPATFDHDETFAIRQGTVGATYDLNDRGDYLWGLGASYTFSLSPAALDSVYGSNPSSWQVYLRVHPNRGAHGGGEHAEDGASDSDGEESHAGH